MNETHALIASVVACFAGVLNPRLGFAYMLIVGLTVLYIRQPIF